jgi:hypothetical protein
MQRIILILLVLSFQAGNAQGDYTLPYFWGQNYWYTCNNKSVNGTVNVGDLDFSTSDWQKVKKSGVKMIRVGGAGYNSSSNNCKPTTYAGSPYLEGYVTIVNNIRKNGCEPVITVPFSGLASAIAAEATAAKNLVTLLNITYKLNVRFWIIANEPGKEHHTVGQTDPYDYYEINAAGGIPSAQQAFDYANAIASYIKPFSQAMKEADPSISIIGPEIESFYFDVIESLMSPLILPNITNAGNPSPACIRGTIPSGSAAGLYYIDVLSIHLYPRGDLKIRSGHQKYPESLVQYNGLSFFFDKTREKIDNPSNPYLPNRSDLQIALDEFNTTYKPTTPDWNLNDLDATDVNAGTDSLLGHNANPNSFLAGQTIADMMLVGLSKFDVFMMNFWSVKENDDLGYISKVHDENKSSYYHYHLVANNFRGHRYKATINSLIPQFNNDEVKAWASVNGNNIAVLLMNQSSTEDFDYSLDLNGTATGGSGSVGFSFSTGKAGQASGSGTSQLKKQSTQLLIFRCSGSTQTLADRYHVEASEMVTAANNNATNFVIQKDVISTPSPATITASSYQGCPSNIGSANLSGSGASSLMWTSNQGAYYYNSNASNLSIPGYYILRGVGDCGIDRDLGVVNFRPPEVNAGLDKNFCNITIPCPTQNPNKIGNNDLPHSSNSNGLFTNITYQWSHLSGNQNPEVTICPNASAYYTLTATDANTGCQNSDVVFVRAGAGTTEVYIPSSIVDVGDEPDLQSQNTFGYSSYLSPPGLYSTNYSTGSVHANPIFGQTAYIHVKMINRGCANPTSSQVQLYWTRGAANQAWSSRWINYPCTGNCTALCGDKVTSAATSVTSWNNFSAEVTVPWSVPAANTFNGCSNNPTGNHGGFSFLAHFSSSSDPLNSNVTANPVPSSWQDVRSSSLNDNNIAYRNIIVYSPFSVELGQGTVNLSSPNFVMYRTQSGSGGITIGLPLDRHGKTLLDYGEVRFIVSPDVITSFINNGEQGAGFTIINDSTIQLSSINATLNDIDFGTRSEFEGKIFFTCPTEFPPNGFGDEPFVVEITLTDLIQINETGTIVYQVERSDWNLDPCSATFYSKITQVASTGKNVGLTVRPNPFNNNLTVSSTSDMASITILNSLGKIIWYDRFIAGTQTLDLTLAQHPPGMYFVEVASSAGLIYRIKIIKQQ